MCKTKKEASVDTTCHVYKIPSFEEKPQSMQNSIGNQFNRKNL